MSQCVKAQVLEQVPLLLAGGGCSWVPQCVLGGGLLPQDCRQDWGGGTGACVQLHVAALGQEPQLLWPQCSQLTQDDCGLSVSLACSLH